MLENRKIILKKTKIRVQIIVWIFVFEIRNHNRRGISHFGIEVSGFLTNPDFSHRQIELETRIDIRSGGRNA